MKTIVALLVLVAVGLIAVGCGSQAARPTTVAKPAPLGDGVTEATPKPAEAESERAPKPGTEITLGDSQFGPMLFDSNDQAIYLFDKETSDKPDCYGDCAAAWPPVLTKGQPVAGKGLKQNLLGTTRRKDGKTQVTYNGHPLYFYVNEGPGEVKCHNVVGFGGTWLVVGPDGEALPG